MYNSQYYTCEQIDERLLQGYLDDYNTQTGQSLTKAQFLTKLGSLFSKEGVIDNTATQIGYYECDTAAGTAAKTITVANYALFAGGSMKVKFANKNTANNATLNINSQGAKALYYQGERASATNSWDANEVVEIYYDGTSYYANNVKGGSGSGVYDVSKEHPTSGPNSDGKFTLEYILNPSNVNELIPVNKRYPGMSIQFVSTSDNKYVQYFLTKDEWGASEGDWEKMNLEEEVSQLGHLTDGAEVDNLELTETSGKYITREGTIENSSLFAYTEKFYVEAGKEIIVTATGYNTNVAMIAKVITEDSAYQYLVMSTDSSEHSYKYIVAEAGYFAASYNNTKARKVQISINTPKLLDKRIDDIEAVLPQLVEQGDENELNLFGASATVLSPSVTSNKYISYGGTVETANNFAYTEKFYAEKGQQIYVKAKGYFTQVAMISKVVTENSSYTPKVISVDATLREYKYIVEDNGYYAASYNKSASATIIVSNNTPSALAQKIEANDVKLSEHETRLLSVEGKTVGASISILTLSETSNMFITGYGTVVSVNGFAYTEKFYVEKGQQITVHGAGYETNVAIISKVNTEGSSYSPCVMSIDSSVHDYVYIANSSGYYAASYSMSRSHSVAISVNTPHLLSERIDEVSSRLDVPNLNNGLFCGIPKVGIIGDSLSSGAGYNPNTHATEDNIQYAWWKALERKSGMTYKRFCQGGMSTRNFITNTTYGLPAALTEGSECNLYIIALAVNDRYSLGPSYLGSTSDIDMEDPDNNEDTFYGNYAKIIQKITAFNSGCKFMLFTDPRTEDDFNVAIRTLAGLFDNCYLVDLSSLYSAYFTTGGFYKQYEDGTAHYPAMAYQSMTNIFEAAMNNCINTNYSAFKQIQYQGQ